MEAVSVSSTDWMILWESPPNVGGLMIVNYGISQGFGVGKFQQFVLEISMVAVKAVSVRSSGWFTQWHPTDLTLIICVYIPPRFGFYFL